MAKIQTRNGRTLYYSPPRDPTDDGPGTPSWFMVGPTGTRALDARKVCIVKLASHWSRFCGAKASAKFTAQLLQAVVKALLVRNGEDYILKHDYTGEPEFIDTNFVIGGGHDEFVPLPEGGSSTWARTKNDRGCAATAAVSSHFDEHGRLASTSFSCDWAETATRPMLNDRYLGFGVSEHKNLTPRALRAKAKAALIQHITTTLKADPSDDGITLAQFIGAMP